MTLTFDLWMCKSRNSRYVPFRSYNTTANTTGLTLSSPVVLESDVNLKPVMLTDVNKDFSHKDQDQVKDLWNKDQDKDKDFTVKDKDKDQDLSLKDRTRTVDSFNSKNK